MELIFPPSKIRHYASQYPVHKDKDIENLVPKVRRNGCLTADDLLGSVYVSWDDDAIPEPARKAVCEFWEIDL